MNILIAPDSFKESLTAEQAAACIAREIRRANPSARIRIRPLADGGEGTARILTRRFSGRQRTARVRDPLSRIVTATWGWRAGDRSAYMDAASSSGLALIPRDRRDPLRSTSYGTGQLISAALNAGARMIIIGLGGTATVDGGIGLLQALGARFLIRSRWFGPNSPCATAGDLARTDRIDLSTIDPRCRTVKFTVLCDVTNPLCGPNGAARTYGSQKGATAAQVPRLDASLRRWARTLLGEKGRRVSAQPGSGAAGGLAFALNAVFDAKLERGIEWMMNALRVEDDLEWADLILTGEGRVDRTSVYGKVVGELARRARAHLKTVIVLAGSLGPGAEAVLKEGARTLICISPPKDPDWKRRARERLGRSARAVLSFLPKEFGDATQ